MARAGGQCMAEDVVRRFAVEAAGSGKTLQRGLQQHWTGRDGTVKGNVSK